MAGYLREDDYTDEISPELAHFEAATRKWRELEVRIMKYKQLQQSILDCKGISIGIRNNSNYDAMLALTTIYFESDEFKPMSELIIKNIQYDIDSCLMELNDIKNMLFVKG